MAAGMRSWLLVFPLLLTGCTQTETSPARSPTGPSPSTLIASLPPALLVDRSLQGTLQLVVHAKQGNLRYDFINITVDNATLQSERGAYTAEIVLNTTQARVVVQVVATEGKYAWRAWLQLNATAKPPTVLIQPLDAANSPQQNATLPFEKLLEAEHL